eukprot:305863-Prymnesium_polylepis.1
MDKLTQLECQIHDQAVMFHPPRAVCFNITHTQELSQSVWALTGDGGVQSTRQPLGALLQQRAHQHHVVEGARNGERCKAELTNITGMDEHHPRKDAPDPTNLD